jgi:hypothetical protein
VIWAIHRVQADVATMCEQRQPEAGNTSRC